MKTSATRFLPNKDLRNEIELFVKQRQVQAGCIITCVGSLQSATLRMANADQFKIFKGPFEIVSLVGTLSINGVHLHISLSDSEGRVIGGHMLEGCPIFTTAELVIGVMTDIQFDRQLDVEAGYDELKVENGKHN